MAKKYDANKVSQKSFVSSLFEIYKVFCLFWGKSKEKYVVVVRINYYYIQETD